MSLARTVRLAAFALAVTVGASGPAAALPQRFAIDAAASRVDFRVRYLGLFALGGRFGHVTGVVVFDPAHWETLEVAIEIPVDTLETHPEFWRSEVLGPRFFDSVRYPTISFRAAGAERTGPANGETIGTLTLHGTTGPVWLRARIAAATGEIEIDGETHIARSAFGLGTTLPFASEEVTVTLHIRAVATAAS